MSSSKQMDRRWKLGAKWHCAVGGWAVPDRIVEWTESTLGVREEARGGEPSSETRNHRLTGKHRSAASSCCSLGTSGFVGELLCQRKRQGYKLPECNSMSLP